MKIYLFGPMRGVPGHNFPAFDAARVRLQELGHMVFCPALLTRALPYVDADRGNPGYLRHVIDQDITCIYHVDALAGLHGWWNSRGSTVEVALALFLQLPVFCAESLRELEIIETPWFARYRSCPPYVKPRGMSLDPCSIGNYLVTSTPKVCDTCGGDKVISKVHDTGGGGHQVYTVPCPSCERVHYPGVGHSY